jgi:hypothetical protein
MFKSKKDFALALRKEFLIKFRPFKFWRNYNLDGRPHRLNRKTNAAECCTWFNHIAFSKGA